MFLTFQSVTNDLKKHATEAIRLENLVLQLPSDTDAQSLAAHLAGIRTKIATLLSQAENGTTVIEVNLFFSLKINFKQNASSHQQGIYCCKIFIFIDYLRLQSNINFFFIS